MSGSRALRGLVVLALVVTVAACATRESRLDGAWVAERNAWFERHPEWRVSGRAALRDGARGGSLSFTWRARGEYHEVRLRTVTGGRQWRLTFRPGHARLEGSDMSVAEAAAPEGLVEEAVGWPIPVSDLAWWIRGLLPPHNRRAEYARDGTLKSVAHAPWELEYHRFEEVEGQLMPVSMEAESGSYRVRLVLKGWQWPAANPAKPL